MRQTCSSRAYVARCKPASRLPGVFASSLSSSTSARVTSARPRPPPHGQTPGQRNCGRRSRAKTSSERGKQFRQRQKAREEELERQVQQLRKQIAHLSATKSVYAQKALHTRTTPSGSLVQLSRELYNVFRHGLETVDAIPTTATAAQRAHHESVRSIVKYKETFLHQVLDPGVVYGNLVGVDALLDQWRKHTSSYAKFEIELGHVEPVAGSQENPVVMLHTTLHSRFSRETFHVMFPFVRARRNELMEKVVDRDITFACVSQFQFSEHGRIMTYVIEINFVEAFAKVLGDPGDVAELMQLSVVSSDTTIVDAVPIVEDASSTEGCGDGMKEASAVANRYRDVTIPRRGKLSMRNLLCEENVP